MLPECDEPINAASREPGRGQLPYQGGRSVEAKGEGSSQRGTEADVDQGLPKRQPIGSPDKDSRRHGCNNEDRNERDKKEERSRDKRLEDAELSFHAVVERKHHQNSRCRCAGEKPSLDRAREFRIGHDCLIVFVFIPPQHYEPSSTNLHSGEAGGSNLREAIYGW